MEKEKKKEIFKVSVRSFVEFILRSGDIDNRISASARQDAMLAGGKLHRKIQRREGAEYTAEVPLSFELEQDCYTLVLEGRADGVIEQRPREGDEMEQPPRDGGGMEQRPCEGDEMEQRPCEGDEMEQPPCEGDEMEHRPCDGDEMEQRPCESDEMEQRPCDGDEMEQRPCEGDEMEQPPHEGDEMEQRPREGDEMEQSPCADATYYVIDEIKGIYQDVQELAEPVPVHLAQAKCYAYFYAEKKHLPKIGVRMTYCNLDTEEIRRFRYDFWYRELEEWFLDLAGRYDKWARFSVHWRESRNASIQTLEFPYPYRQGQKKLAAGVYTSILRQKNLFIQAPTGTGKTLSVLFPAIRAVGEGLGEKIFYLTAKTVTRTVAKETAALLKEHGYRAKVLEITAKEKMCLMEETDCNPQYCPYALGHFDRVNEAVFELLQNQDDFWREDFTTQAKKRQVCPFELCLDMAEWADLVVCDYNYVFDPNVRLKRFFAEGVKGEYLFLVDEAHNLVERARKMYSAKLYKEDFLSAKKTLKPYSRQLERLLEACNRKLLEKKRECGVFTVCKNIDDFLFALLRLAPALDDFLRERRDFERRDEIVEFYMQVRHFLNIADLVDENYVVYYEQEEGGRFAVRLYCVGTAENLQNCLDRGKCAVFFSATLLPVSYYKKMLTKRDDSYAVYAQTVFESSQSCVLIAGDVSSRYTRRTPEEFAKIAAYIAGMVEQKNGNYIAFFPSYRMLEQVSEQFFRLPEAQKMDCIVQKGSMDEGEREAFLGEFLKEREKSLCAFCVMGGIFGEGIDLRGEQLIGVAVVGTGLPQVCTEREILKQYYEEAGEDGFAYAYTYPGMNKVLQAAGRVIRTAEDRGVVLLLDERFCYSGYRKLFPREWGHAKRCSIGSFRGELQEFWGSGEA